MTRRIVLCTFILLICLPLPAKAKALRYTLKEAVEHALVANPSVEAKLLAMEKAKMDVGVATSYFLPTVSLISGRSKMHNEGGSGSSDEYSNITVTNGMRIGLSLFAGFAHLNNLQKSMLTVDVENARHGLARLELIGNIQLMFLNLLKAREDIKTVQESKKRIMTQLKAAQAFVKVGMAPYLNVLQNEVELARVRQEEIRAANTIRTAKVTLNKYLNYDTDVPVEYVGELSDYSGVVPYTEEEALQVSLYSRPDLIIAQKSVAVATKQSHITAGRYLPTVNFSFDSMRSRKDYNPDGYPFPNDYSRSYWNLGFNFSWEIFSGGGTTFALLGDRKAMASMRKDYENAMTTAKADVIKALLDIEAARELIATSRKGLEAAKESYAMADRRYQTNTGTITELLDAQVRLTEAEGYYSTALAEFQSARSRFFYNIGRENTGLD